MFSAWNFSQWLGSVGATMMMLAIMTGFSALVSYSIVRIWGEESGTWEQTSLGKANTETRPPSRRAA